MRLSRIAPASVVAGLFAALAIPASSIGQGSASAPPPAGNPPFLGVPVTAFSPGGTMPIPPIAPPSLSDTAAINRGQGYFSQFNCVGCHGADGSGSDVGKSLHAPDLRSHKVQMRSNADLARFISDGSGAMPPFKDSLDRQQILDVVHYVRHLGSHNMPRP